LDLTIELVKRPSISPDDAGCQDIIAARLERLGFKIERLNFGETSNLWATHRSEGAEPGASPGQLFAFVGHTDVVPTGPLDEWDSPPFEPEVRDGILYGRGTADMKCGVAAFVTAVERFLSKGQHHTGTLALLLTSDEEADASDGTIKVIEHLTKQGIKIDYCLVGEPSASSTIGDTIKNGRRGSLHCLLKIKGQQGHVAYPEKALNPVHKALGALNELASKQWDKGNQYFPPTSFQISNIHAGTGADNVIPGSLDVVSNFRFSTEQTPEGLQQATEAILNKYDLQYDAKFKLSGLPFLTDGGKLLDAVVSTIKEVVGIETILSTAGGTSDGRLVAPTGAEVVELGVINASIHKINEHADVHQMDVLSEMFERIVEKMLR
jgi:succinyl-diaminopimelate desuccinylase